MDDNRECCLLRLPQYSFWYDAIVENDFGKVQDILHKSTKLEKNKLVNDPFEFGSNDLNGLPLAKQISNRFEVKYPLQLAAVLGYKQSFDVLMENDANIFIKDNHENNILHLMCYIVNSNSQEEENIRAFYKHLLKSLSHNEMTLLLTQKNELNWNPEVTAISLGVLGIFLDMFMSKGLPIYL